MLAYAHRKAVPEYTSELLVFTGVPEEAHAVSWRWLWLRLPVLLLSYFPREGWEANTTHAFDPFQSRLLNDCLLERRGRERDSGTAVARQWHGSGSARLGSALQRVRGTTWPQRRCKRRGFPMPPGLGAEAPDVAALGRQSSFNPRAGIHVSRAPLALRAPTQGQPWVRLLGGAPGGSGPGRGITCAPRTGFNQLTQCARLESISASSEGRGKRWK